MKIVPTYKLVAIAVIPVLAALTAAFYTDGLAVLVLTLLLLLAIGFFDMLSLLIDAPRFKVIVPDVVRLTCHKQGTLVVRVSMDRELKSSRMIYLGAPFSVGIDCKLNPLPFKWPAGAGAVEVSFEIIAHERGEIPMQKLFLQSGSIFGLWSSYHSLPVKLELRVYPPLSPGARRMAARFLTSNSAGLSMVRVLGQGREFERLRDYMPGDSYSDIDWKATARRRRPVTRLYQAEHTQKVLVAVDTGRLSARRRKGDPVLDRYINAALFLGQIAQKNGDHFGVLTFSDRVTSYVRPGSGQAHYNACRELLCHEKAVACSPAYDELFSFLRLHLSKRTLVLILTDLDDPLLSEKFLNNVDLAIKRHLVHVCMPRPQLSQSIFEKPVESVAQIYQCVAGDLVSRDLDMLRRELAAKGVVLKLTDPDDAAVALVNQYLDIKQRQIL